MAPMRRQCYWRERLGNTSGFHLILTLLWPLIMQACCIFLQHCKPFSIVSKFNICDWNFYLTTIILLCDYHSHSSIHDYCACWCQVSGPHWLKCIVLLLLWKICIWLEIADYDMNACVYKAAACMHAHCNVTLPMHRPLHFGCVHALAASLYVHTGWCHACTYSISECILCQYRI